MLTATPLMIIPLALYNIAILGSGVLALDRNILSVSMLSGALWTLSIGDVCLLVGLVVLFIEIIKATRNGSASLFNHVMSMLVFVAFLVEFLLVSQAATQIFFILTVIAFIDVAGGFAVSVRSASRDVSIGL